MPFKSKAQQRYMFATHPEIAKRWADHTPDIKSLPERVGKGKKKKRKPSRKSAAQKALSAVRSL